MTPTRRFALHWLINLLVLGWSIQGSFDADFGSIGKQRTVPLVPSNSFKYVFQTLPREHEALAISASVGRVPSWIQGDFVKTGFCGFDQPGANGMAHNDPAYKFTMLFDALGCGYRLSFRGGVVKYWGKKLRSRYYNESLEGIPPFRIFKATEPAPSWWETLKIFTQFDNSNNLNVNMVMMSSPDADHIVAISDVEGEQEFDLRTMRSLGQYPWDDELSRDTRVVVNTCAHPSKIADDPALYNYRMILDVSASGVQYIYSIYKVDPTQRGERHDLKRAVVAEIPTDKHHYVHHFAQTPNYVVIVEMPLFWKVLKIITGTTIKPALSFDPSHGVRAKVINTKTGELEKEYLMPDESFFCFHHVNAYEDDNGDIVMDLATYDDIGYHLGSFELGGHHSNNTHDLPPGTVRRIRLPHRSGGDAIVTKIGTVDLELPIVNNNYRGRPYRYVYAHSKSRSNRAGGCKSGPGCGGTWWDTIVKLDVETGEEKTWHRDDHWPSEPTFVPRPGGSDEDDGVLLDMVTHGGEDGEGGAMLVVLDAKTMDTLAELPLPSFVPYQSHGSWLPLASVRESAPGYPVQRELSEDSTCVGP